jgi:hypothetical protein
MQQQPETVTYYFKKVFTCQTKYYTFEKDTSISNFINMVKNMAYNDFNIDRNYIIEIVESGQEIPDQNLRGEDGYPLIAEINQSLRSKYDNLINQPAFYIRVLNV